jgi:predicted glycosyltransferase involved in capsule biosynthesis
MQMQINEYWVAIDRNKTIDYYTRNTMCDCFACRNYSCLVKDSYPELDSFLLQFGVDILRPDENFWWVADHKKKTVCYNPVYTVNGQIEFIELKIHEKNYNIMINSAYFPNKNTEPYFAINIMDLIMPWTLDEPFEETFPLQKKRAPLLWRFFKKT